MPVSREHSEASSSLRDYKRRRLSLSTAIVALRREALAKAVVSNFGWISLQRIWMLGTWHITSQSWLILNLFSGNCFLLPLRTRPIPILICLQATIQINHLPMMALILPVFSEIPWHHRLHLIWILSRHGFLSSWIIIWPLSFETYKYFSFFSNKLHYFFGKR